MSRLVFPLVLLAVACGGSPPPAAPATPAPGAEATAEVATRSGMRARPAPAEPLPPIPAQPVPAPDALVVTAVVPSPDAILTQVGRLAEAAQPGMRQLLGLSDTAALLESALGRPLRGVDLDAPVRAALFAWDEVDEPWVLVVKVTDADALAGSLAALPVIMQVHRGHAVIGNRPTLERAAGYALTTLAGEAVPDASTLRFFAGPFFAAIERELDKGMHEAVAQLVRERPAFAEAASKGQALIRDSLHQLDEMRLVIDMQQGLTMRFEILAREDSGAARLFAAQTPSDFALLRYWPEADIVSAGQFETRPMLKPMLEVARLAAEAQWGDAGVAMAGALEAFLMSDPGQHVSPDDFFTHEDSSLYVTSAARPVADIRHALEVGRRMQALVDPMFEGLMTTEVKRRAFRHAGVDVAEVSFGLGAAPPPGAAEAFAEEMGGQTRVPALFATTNGLLVMAWGPDARALMQAALERIRSARRGQLPAMPSARKPLLAAARAAGASQLVFFDLTAYAARLRGLPVADVTPGMITVIFGDRDMTMHLHMDEAQMRGFFEAVTALLAAEL